MLGLLLQECLQQTNDEKKSEKPSGNEEQIEGETEKGKRPRSSVSP